MKNELFTTKDNKQVALYEFDNVTKPRAVVQIAHGMSEHSQRYKYFADYLNSQGYIVVMNDLRGHGSSTTVDSYGYEAGDNWTNNINDQIAISNYCVDKYKLPLVMMGHSYGSFLTQRLMEINNIPVAFILSGSCYMNTPTVSLGKIIAKNMCRNKGGKYPAELLATMSFRSYDKHFKQGTNAWLSRDTSIVEEYNNDKMCGYVCSANFYRSFFTGLKQIYKKAELSKIDTAKPLLIFSGSDDPVGNYSKGVTKLSKMYKKLKISDITTILYEGGRHEMLNETNKQEVYQAVVEFLNRVIK